MQNPRYLIAPILLSWMVAVPVLAYDFAPMRLGNVWKYRGSSEDRGPHGLGRFVENLEVRVAERRSHDGAIRWHLQFTDSLTQRTGSNVNGGRNIPLADTILTYEMILEEANGVFTVVDRPDLGLPILNFHPDFESMLEEDLLFMSRSRPNGAREIPNPNGLPLIEAKYDAEPFGYGVGYWKLFGTGLIWSDLSNYNGSCRNFHRILVLESFNGRKVSLPISTPTSPLAKEAKISCSIRRTGDVGPSVRLGNGSLADLLGRAIGPGRGLEMNSRGGGMASF